MREIKNTTVCVVGGAGFLGSHLVDYLIEEKGCKVLVIDNLITGRREFIHEEADFEWCDITQSEEYLYKLFTNYQVRFVFNYAAEPYIPVSFARPLHVFNINAFGALKVINAAHEVGCEGILQVSSAEIYGEAVPLQLSPGQTALQKHQGTQDYQLVEGQTGKIKESDPVLPHSTYGAAKAAIDAMVRVRWKEAQAPVIAMRQFNCVGERETHEYVIPEIISQFARGDQREGMWYQIFLGNNAFRDFQYAGDAVRMAVELLEKGEFGEVYNMGSEDGIRIYDLARLIGGLMGHRAVNVVKDTARIRPWEIWHLQSDNTKLYSVIEHRAKTPLKETLQKTIDWYNENDQKWPWEV